MPAVRIPRRLLGAVVAVVAAAGAGGGVAAGASPPRADLVVVRARVALNAPTPQGPRPLPVVAYLVNRGGAVEVHARRTPGAPAWHAAQITDGAPSPLPPGVRVGPTGIEDAVVVTVLDRSRAVVRRRALDICLNDDALRLGPSGPAESGFPLGCVTHPFGTGLRMGLDTDYGVRIDLGPAVGYRLAAGAYTLRVRMRPAVAEWLGMAPRDRAATLALRVHRVRAPRGAAGRGLVDVFGTSEPAGTHREPRYRRPSRGVPPATGAVPPADGLPDLAALPAYDIQTATVRTGGGGTLDTLQFAATVWNAGPGPLIVEGFRPGRSPRMAAYQFFRRPGSREDGSAVSVGGLDYDARTGHDHWHFRDFARYSLVRANGRTVSVSRKEAWCLAPTDQIDQLVPNAEMRPGDGSLYSACGDADAVQVREVLEVGAGDTYGLGTPGQAIDITHLPDGVYFLKIEANPAGALRDAADGNDVALRRIVLGGSPGHRTVGVPPAEGIDSEGSAARLSATCSYCLP